MPPAPMIRLGRPIGRVYAALRAAAEVSPVFPAGRVQLSRRAVLGAAGVPVLGAATRSDGAAIAQAAAALPEIDVAGDAVMTLGYRHAGDGGGAIYRRVAGEPAHRGKLRARDGGWFELAETVVRPEMFGARGDSSDDRAALQAALDHVVARRGRLELGRSYALAGHLTVGRGARGFTIAGAGHSRLEQLNDNTSHFYFAEEDSAHWTIRGIEFAWTRNQGPQHPLSYAIRFDTRTATNYGHRNFEVADCYFVNGWRGIGVTPDPHGGLPCPVWGATLRMLRCGEAHGGALIFLAGFGKTGQPNIALEHIYVRGDAMQEAAIRLEGCDTVEMRGVEFNLTRHAGIEFRYSRSLLATAVRFEQSRLSHGSEAMIVVDGAMSRATITGLTLQDCAGATGGSVSDGCATVRAMRGARVTVREAVTLAALPVRPLALAAADGGGHVELDGIGHCGGHGVSLVAPGQSGDVSFTPADRVRITPGKDGARIAVAQPGIVAEIVASASAGVAARLRIERVRDGQASAIPLEVALPAAAAPRMARVRLNALTPAAAVRPGDWLMIRAQPAGAVEAAILIARD